MCSNSASLLCILMIGLLGFQEKAGAEAYTTAEPKFRSISFVDSKFRGNLDVYLEALSGNWLKTMPDRNPAILTMFRDREKKPTHNLLPWSGEFAGKYLTGAVEFLKLTNDPELRNYLQGFVDQLIEYQADDGYLGPWPKKYQLTGTAPNTLSFKQWQEYDQWVRRNFEPPIPVTDPNDGWTWDSWGNYHVMLGLLKWYDYTGDKNALSAAIKIGDLFCNTFLSKPGSWVRDRDSEKNLAPLQTLCMLYKITGTDRYLELAKQIVDHEFPKGGNYINIAMEGKEFYQSPLARWEALHPVLGIAEMYYITGDEKYKKAFEHLWWSIVQYDRHNTGGFSSGETAAGNPYSLKAIETCCNVAWSAMSVRMLELTGNSIVADELELTLTNAITGYQFKSGRECTYNTPMDGRQVPFTSGHIWQKRPGSEELNCCHANMARGFGLLSEWALMADDDGLALNYYGPSRMTTEVKGIPLTLKQDTEYPAGDGTIAIHVLPEKPVKFDLKLRIPHWSPKTYVEVNGKRIKNVSAGTYLPIGRKWKKGDTVKIKLDMSLHFWAGEKQCEGKVSIFRGPVLLAKRIKDDYVKPKFTGDWKDKWLGTGHYYRSKEPNATAEFTFEGDAIELIMNKNKTAGKARIELDGVESELIDFYSAKPDEHLIWTKTDLGPGTHTIKLTVLGQKNETSEDSWVWIQKMYAYDCFDVNTMKVQLLDDDKNIVSVRICKPDGTYIDLGDFDSIGEEGREYKTWLKINNVPKVEFSKSNPLRSFRANQ